MPKKTQFPHGFFMLPNDIFGAGNETGWAAGLGPIGFALFALIVRRYDFENRRGLYESHASMARRLGVSEPTVEKHLARLVDLGLVDRVACGKRRHTVWAYVPRLPLRVVPSEPRVEDSNTQTPWALNTKVSRVMDGRIPKMTGVNTQNDVGPQTVESARSQQDASLSRGANILFNRLYMNMSIEERVRRIRSQAQSFNLSTLVQAAWEYWKHLWEGHYGRPYYRAQNPANQSIVAKDKKNLRNIIEQVGFPELITRMERCFEVCDKLFPCRQYGKWVRPISLDDFVNTRLFDYWIPPREESAASAPISAEEKLRAALQKHVVAASRGVDEDVVEDDV